MTKLNLSLHSHHHFTTPYCPKSNESVESVCEDVLRACHALLSEFRINQLEWPISLPMLQIILDNSKKHSLGTRALITAFLGLPTDNNLRRILLLSTPSSKPLDLVKAQKIDKVIRVTFGTRKKSSRYIWCTNSKTRTRNRDTQREDSRSWLKFWYRRCCSGFSAFGQGWWQTASEMACSPSNHQDKVRSHLWDSQFGNAEAFPLAFTPPHVLFRTPNSTRLKMFSKPSPTNILTSRRCRNF